MLLDILFPNRCTGCGVLLDAEEIFCPECLAKLSFTAWPFASENDLKARCRLNFPIENGWALLLYEKGGLSQKIIHQLKYSHRERVSNFLGEMAAAQIGHQLTGVDCIVPIPLAKAKFRKRGYNQLSGFAEEISKISALPVENGLLCRPKGGKSQASKTQKQRLSSQDPFVINKRMSNTHFLLVDDVITSGTTLSFAAWHLLKCGENNRVSIAVMAID